MKKFLLILLVCHVLVSCSLSKHRQLQKQSSIIWNDTVFKNQFLGLLVYDPIKKDTVVSYNSHKYFLPASNTKIVTLYTALQALPDKIPSLKYLERADTLFIQGTGDPTLLHPYFNDSTAISFLKNYKNIALHLNNFDSQAYGPGWAWEDFEFYFQPERNSFPMYGNVVTLSKTNALQVSPSYFKNKVREVGYPKRREQHANVFYLNPLRKDTLETPFIVDSLLTKTLLEELLAKKISITPKFPEGQKSILYSVPSDSVYKRMMEVSDNFLAEQLLILASSMLSDTLSVEKAQKHILKNQLVDLMEPPRWVDGSGLSRYNLFSPTSFVQILEKMYREQPKERLFNLMPIRGRLPVDQGITEVGIPYLYAKSGSFGNNYSLSGYLLTNSGKVLIFSFMNNHYKAATADIRKKMYELFENIRDNY